MRLDEELAMRHAATNSHSWRFSRKESKRRTRFAVECECGAGMRWTVSGHVAELPAEVRSAFEQFTFGRGVVEHGA